MNKDNIHVTPINDLQEHVENGTSCICLPKIILEGDIKIIIHNSFDGREFQEGEDRRQ